MMQVSRASGAEFGFNLDQPFLKQFLCSLFSKRGPASLIPITTKPSKSAPILQQRPAFASTDCHNIRFYRHAGTNVSTRSKRFEFPHYSVNVLM